MEGYLSCAETAKLVRNALKKAFPSVKFSVRSRTYSGGASIDVDWTLGPTANQVKAVACQFSGSDFDGMIDLKHSHSSWLMPDGSAVVAHDPGTVGSAGIHEGQHNEKPHPDARLVHFRADYIFCNREIPEELKERIGRDLCDLQRVEHCGRDTRGLLGDADTYYLSDHVHQVVSRTAFAAGEEYAGVRFSTPEEERADAFQWVTVEKRATTEPEKPETAPIASVDGATVTENEDKNGVEIRFPSKPEPSVLDALKSHGWRWSRFSACWYHPRTPETVDFARALVAS